MKSHEQPIASGYSFDDDSDCDFDDKDLQEGVAINANAYMTDQATYNSQK